MHQKNRNLFKNSGSNEHGFTFIEVVIAMAIFSIGILGVAAMQTTAAAGNSSARRVTNITNVAADHVERLISLPYNHTDLGSGNHAGPVAPEYSVNWTVTDDTPVSGTKTLWVTVQARAIDTKKTVTIQQIKADII